MSVIITKAMQEALYERLGRLEAAAHERDLSLWAREGDPEDVEERLEALIDAYDAGLLDD